MTQPGITAYLLADEQAREAGCSPGATQPAFRAWADALLELAAERAGDDRTPAVAMRSTAQILPLSPPSSENHVVTVTSSGCALAYASGALLTPRGWRQELRDHLVEIGLDRDEVEEHLLPCAAPLVPMRVAAAREVVTGTRPDLLRAIMTYFADDVRRYLESWQAAEHPAAGVDLLGWHLVVPMEAARS